jgi:LacI family transcriptional regulator
MSGRVRMIDIAEKAGVSAATVSLALSNHPRISDATKARITEICEQMGFQPDPVAKAFKALGRSNRNSEHPNYLGTVALLESESRAKAARVSLGEDRHREVIETFSRTGYRLDPFIVGPSEKEQRALNRILLSRGIQGLLIYGQNREIHQWALDWECFAAVSISASIHEHFSHNVMISSYQDVYDAMIKLDRRGYRRAGLYIVGVDGNLDYWLAGVVTAQHELGKKKIIPCLNVLEHAIQKAGREEFMVWFERYKPDLIITTADDRLPRFLATIGVNVPDDVGVVCLDIVPSMKHMSGFIQRRDVCFQVVVDLLHGMLIRNEIGPPEQPYCIQIPPQWNEGKTLRPG